MKINSYIAEKPLDQQYGVCSVVSYGLAMG